MNVIWVVSDTFRRDHLGAYGNKDIHTPSLDNFTNKSMRFDRFYAAGFPTMPTRADHFTGRWTMSYMKWEPMFPEEVTLSQMLAEQGIHTAAVVDVPYYVRNGMNYDRGFKTFHEIPGQPPVMLENDDFHKEVVDVRNERRYEVDYAAPASFNRAMQWLEDHRKEDFFLYIDVWDPHEPFDPPLYYAELYYPGIDELPWESAPYRYLKDVPEWTEERFNKAYAGYCGEITMVDTWFGNLMRKVENLGMLENTAVIFTTDHGFYFGEHGGIFGKAITVDIDEKDMKGAKGSLFWSASFLYEEVVAIPLMIYIPGMKPGSYDGLVSAVDLMPTVLELMGQDIPPSVQGKSLLPVFKDNSLPWREYVITAAPLANSDDVIRIVDDQPRKMKYHSTATVTTQEWSLCYSVIPGQSELYNIPDDPKQENNIIAQYPEKAQELHGLFLDFMRETNVSKELLEPRLRLQL